MRALLIDPTNGQQSIIEIQHDGTLQGIYKAMDCKMIEAPISYPNGDVLYCNEEAWTDYHLQKEEDELNMGGFMFPEWSYPILGKSLIVGIGEEGDTVDCKSDPADFRSIAWLDYNRMMAWGMKVGLV